MPDIVASITLKDGTRLNYEFNGHDFFVSLGVLKPMFAAILDEIESLDIDGAIAYADDAPNWRAHLLHAIMRSRD